ncbi:hypothetical protein [Zooshikella ganghwensis]|uniref:hypothetical protein n=1 Tax=Zooshikella ganghwensis TaxID=202772 RepID=UPI0003F729B9|nr:hypothetical protein [Zooshikella ganghwensis]
MDKKRVIEKLRRGAKSLEPKKLNVLSTPIDFRIGSILEKEGLVPTFVRFQRTPVFVSPEIYLNIEHIHHAEVAAKPHPSQVDRVAVRFTQQGIERINALVGYSDLPTLVIYINNVSVASISITSKIPAAPVEFNIFESDEEAEYFVSLANSVKA